jgi:hypothetical protein
MASTVEITNTDSPYLAGGDQIIYVDASSGAVTVNLPAVTSGGASITVIVVDDTNTVTIDPITSGETVWDGALQKATITLAKGDGIDFIPRPGQGEWWRK